MTNVLLFLSAKILLLLFGAPVAYAPSVRRLGLAARLATAYIAGHLVLSVAAVAFSLLRIEMTTLTMAVPFAGLGLVFAIHLSRRLPAAAAGPGTDVTRARSRFAQVTTVTTLVCVFVGLLSTRATSADYLYFWGAKAARFAEVGRIDAELLANPYMIHLRGLYPPLVTLAHAWSALVAGDMPWVANLANAAIWLVVGTVILNALLRDRYGRATADAIIPFWTVVIGASLIHSYSGGSAEAPLVCFTTLGAASLFLGGGALTPLCFAAAVLTKVEGTMIAVLCIGAALLARRLAERRPSMTQIVAAASSSAAAYLMWWGFQRLEGLPTSDPMRQRVLDLDVSRFPAVVATMAANMDAGTFGLSWIVAFAIAAFCMRRWRTAFGPLLVSLSIVGFYAVYYLHERRPLELVMGWEVPRITQPALSLLALAAGLALHAPPHRGETVDDLVSTPQEDR